MSSQIISSFDTDSHIKTFPHRCFPGRLAHKRSSLFPCLQGSFGFSILYLEGVQVHERGRRLPLGKLQLIL